MKIKEMIENNDGASTIEAIMYPTMVGTFTLCLAVIGEFFGGIIDIVMSI